MRFPALAHRDFTLFWLAASLSRLGSEMRVVAIGWQIYLLTKSPVALGMIGAARVIPILILALAGGAAADKFERRKVLVVTQATACLLSCGLAFAAFTGRITPGLLYAALACSGALAAFDNPARQSLLVNLVPARDVPNALSLSITASQLATTVGPAIGGFVLAASSAAWVYAIDAGTFVAMVAALVIARPGDVALQAAREQARAAPAVEAADAKAPPKSVFALLAERPVLVQLMLVDFFATFFGGAHQLFPIFANEVFHVGERGLGMLVSAPAVGALAASALLSARPAIERQGLAVVIAVAVYGCAIVAFGLTSSFPLALAFLAVSGAADAVSTVVRQTARQTITPDHLRGRMTGVNMLFFMTGPQLGEVEAGFAAKWLGVRGSVVSGGVLCLVVAVGALGLGRLRRLRAEPAAL